MAEAVVNLSTINEEEEEVAEWETISDPDRLKKFRSAAKSNHTKSTKKLLLGIKVGEDRDQIRTLRALIVRDYDEMERRHDRYLRYLIASPDDIEAEAEWLRGVTQQHRDTLATADDHLATFSTPSVTSRHSSRRSSSSSTRARIREADRLEKEAELKLKQAEEEAKRREEEDDQIRQMDEFKKKVEADRKQRELKDEVEKQRLTGSIMRQQLAEEESPELDSAVSVKSRSSTKSRQLTLIAPQAPTPLTSRSIMAKSQVSPGISTDVSVPKAFVPTQLFPTDLPGATISSGVNVAPSGGVLSQFRNFANKALNALTPNRKQIPTYTATSQRLSRTTSAPSLVNNSFDGYNPISRQMSKKEPTATPSLGPNLQQESVKNTAIEQTDKETFPIAAAVNLSRQDVSSQRPKMITKKPLLPTYPENVSAPVFLPKNSSTPAVSSYAARMGTTPYNFPNQYQQSGPPAAGNPQAFNNDLHLPVARQPGFYDSAAVDPPFQQNVSMIPETYTPDAWIYQLGSSQAPLSVRSFVKPPRLELQKFYGDPRKWPMFIQSFRVQVHDACDSDAERLTHLRNCLSPEIQKQIGEALLNPGLYHFALKELHRKFGNPQIVSQCCTASLLKLQSFKDNDYDSLRSFAAELHSVVATRQLGGYGMELFSNATLSQLVSKLPPLLKSRWGETSWKMQPRLPSVLDFDEWFDNVSMAEYSIRAGFLTYQTQSSGKKQNRHQQSPGPNVYSVTKQPESSACFVCKAKHPLKDCRKFKSLTVEKRAELAKEKGVCFRCLSSSHIGPHCKEAVPCDKGDCGGRHHPLLHGAPIMFPRRLPATTPQATTPQASAPPAGEPGFVGLISGQTVGGMTMLPIVPVCIKSNGHSCQTFALLDPGSEITMVRKEIMDRLGLKGSPAQVSYGTVNGPGTRKLIERVDFNISSLDDTFTFKIEDAQAVTSLNLVKRPFNLDKLVEKWPHLNGVPIHSSSIEDVALLIGQDHPAPLEVFEIRTDPNNQRAPRAQCTAFGWIIVGPVKRDRYSDAKCYHISVNNDDNMAQMVENFIQADTFGTKPGVSLPMGIEERRAWSILKDTTRHIGDRYESGLLWKSDNPMLPDNRVAALNRFTSLEKKFKADPIFAGKYKAVIDEYVALKHARKLTEDEIANGTPGRIRYNPHHAVRNPFKPNKFRVVFDLSAKCHGLSLNDHLLKGPNLLSSGEGMLLRFRENEVGLVADVTKMFHQVRVRKADVSAFRFFWRPPESTNFPDTYEMDVHVFGAISSPAVCSYVLQQAARDSGEEADDMVHQIVRHFYVDNWLVSFKTIEEACSIAHKLTDALEKGGFPLTQWATSSDELRASLPGQSQLNETLNMDLDDLPIERTLGLSWNYRQDVFVLKVSVSSDGSTKRDLLRTISSIFDPLGFLVPIIFSAKFLLQDVWRLNVGWDEPLTPGILDRWREWTSSLSALENLAIRRFITPKQDFTSIELHVFGDASEIGFGAVAYARFVRPDGADVSFLDSKSRIAPMKFVTIPRMELCAAVLAVRLTNLLLRELDLKFDKVFYWSDSTTVLCWIKSQSCRFQIYVGNRVGEILETSSAEQWSYVPSDLNPGDDASRGLNAAELTVTHRWFSGPSFLQGDSVSWPKSPTLPQIQSGDPEVRETNWIGAIIRDNDAIDELISRCSRIHFITRVVAYVLRWQANRRQPKDKRVSGVLQAPEISAAHEFLLRRAQENVYRGEIDDLRAGRPLEKDSSLLKLAPYLDHRGLLCVGGRIGNAPLPLDVRHPVILPANERLTELIVFQMHLERAHPSAEHMHHEVRKQYWIIRGRLTVQRILNKCLVCKRYKAKGLSPLMAALPPYRLQAGCPAFTHTGVDYFGPYEVIILRRRVKRWACLFTCLSSRAVHIEMAYTLETDSFICALNRFELRRGVPSSYHSDNGTNFVGAERELSECLARLDQTAIIGHLSRKQVNWHFNPPSAPHFGGVWERLVQSAKRALWFILNGRTLTDEVLLTTLIQVESLLNSRPLTYISVNPTDPEPLTPNHLLLGRANPNLPPDVFTERDLTAKKRWRTAQAISDHFWRRWMREYVPCLTERRKWLTGQKNLQVGDIVVIIDPDSPRGTWPIGKVTRVCIGDNKVVRSAFVQTRGTELHRPATKLCLLESADVRDGVSEDLSSVPSSVGHRAGDVLKSMTSDKRRRVTFADSPAGNICLDV